MIAKPAHTIEAMRINYLNHDAESMSSAEMDVNPIKTEFLVTKKSVSFRHEIAQCQETLHVNDYTDEELFSCWYIAKDFEQMKKEEKPALRLLKKGLYPGDNNELCSRGLEYRYKQGAEQRRNNKAMGWMSVLEEQMMQANEGVRDDEALSRVYIAVNQHTRSTAYTTGLMDELDAECEPLIPTKKLLCETQTAHLIVMQEKKKLNPFSRVFGKRNKQ